MSACASLRDGTSPQRNASSNETAIAGNVAGGVPGTGIATAPSPAAEGALPPAMLSDLSSLTVAAFNNVDMICPGVCPGAQTMRHVVLSDDPSLCAAATVSRPAGGGRRVLSFDWLGAPPASVGLQAQNEAHAVTLDLTDATGARVGRAIGQAQLSYGGDDAGTTMHDLAYTVTFTQNGSTKLAAGQVPVQAGQVAAAPRCAGLEGASPAEMSNAFYSIAPVSCAAQGCVAPDGTPYVGNTGYRVRLVFTDRADYCDALTTGGKGPTGARLLAVDLPVAAAAAGKAAVLPLGESNVAVPADMATTPSVSNDGVSGQLTGAVIVSLSSDTAMQALGYDLRLIAPPLAVHYTSGVALAGKLTSAACPALAAP